MKPVIKLFFLSLISLTLLSCSTAPATFYVLSAIPHSRSTKLSGHHINVGLGPITIAKYLEQPQIVSRNNKNQLELNEYQRWTSPIEDNITRVLHENLSYILSTANIFEYPWPSNLKMDYQVEINIWQFDTSEAGQSILKVNWTLLAKDGKKFLLKKTNIYRATLPTPINYKTYVATMSRQLAQFSRDVAGVITRSV